MSDASFQSLLPYLQQAQSTTLWIADENVLHTGKAIAAREQLTVITNRYDVYTDCLKHSLQTHFSDYDLSAIADSSVDTLIYRVSKEKPVVHHILNEAWRTLKPRGQLVISGEKNEGAKSYVEKAGQLLGHKVPAKKLGNSYLGVITKQRSYDPSLLLDDKHYRQIREIATWETLSIFSKPGLFGWEKIDRGSQLLMTSAEELFAQHSYPRATLDLGCGYGYLTLRTQHWPQLERRHATDNNAAAIACANVNFEQAGMAVTVTADDCGGAIVDRFDCILCNPPFHQGFSVDSQLTDKFLRNSAQRLITGGVALFVVNQFIGLEKKATEYFTRCVALASDGQFKVLALYK